MPTKGRDTFTSAEVAEFRGLIAAKQGRPKSEQKVLRDELRKHGFYISDFGNFDGGITVAAFDELIAGGELTVER